MLNIIFEGILFVALVATIGALVVFTLRYYTPLGTRLRQIENRRRIERVAELACPIHGMHAEDDMVRLPSGVCICPECFKETMYGYDRLDQ